LTEIVSFWVSEHTNQIISLTASEKLGKEKFLKLIELSFKKDPFLDYTFFQKKYALKDKKNQLVIDKIDKQRIEYTKNILMEMNFSENEATIKSLLFYKYLIGCHEMIRYKKQVENYTTEVKAEINQFIKY
jgi:hypothetical protein